MLIEFKELQKITGYKLPGAVEKCLVKQGVRMLKDRKGQPFTTSEALNRALGIEEIKPIDHFEF